MTIGNTEEKVCQRWSLMIFRSERLLPDDDVPKLYFEHKQTGGWDQNKLLHIQTGRDLVAPHFEKKRVMSKYRERPSLAFRLRPLILFQHLFLWSTKVYL